MDYGKIKKEIKEIIEISSSVPEALRERCFEILLENLIAETKEVSPPASPNPKEYPSLKKNNVDPGKPAGQSIPTPAKVRVFMQRTGVTDEDLQALFLYEDEELHFIKEPAASAVAVGQIEWALLIALKNGILKNDMSCDAESVRSICQEKGYYDSKNFTTIFKRSANAKLFNLPLEPQGDAQPLSIEGQAALGKIVKSLVGAEV
jgi:hypothetical protein